MARWQKNCNFSQRQTEDVSFVRQSMIEAEMNAEHDQEEVAERGPRLGLRLRVAGAGERDQEAEKEDRPDFHLITAILPVKVSCPGAST